MLLKILSLEMEGFRQSAYENLNDWLSGKVRPTWVNFIKIYSAFNDERVAGPYVSEVKTLVQLFMSSPYAKASFLNSDNEGFKSFNGFEAQKQFQQYLFLIEKSNVVVRCHWTNYNIFEVDVTKKLWFEKNHNLALVPKCLLENRNFCSMFEIEDLGYFKGGDCKEKFNSLKTIFGQQKLDVQTMINVVENI